jgi:hypothetical protein
MIKPEDFYSENEYPGGNTKKQMWNRIGKSVPRESRAPIVNIDFRSFAFGFGMAFTVIFVCVGIFTLFSKYVSRDEPAYVKINNAYSKAIEEVEKSIPRLSTVSSQSNSGVAKLTIIDAGIKEIQSDSGPGDVSPVKQNRLRDLYKMKLEILSRMIDVEESKL